MKILVVKSIFCCDISFIEIIKESIYSLITNIIFFKITDTISILCIGWLSDPNYKSMISQIFDSIDLPSNISIYFNIFELNYGKIYIFNKIKDYITTFDSDIVLYLDHDILFTIDYNIFSIMAKLQSVENIGYIALNQLDDCRHQHVIYKNTIKINNIIICYPDDLQSIASGAIIMSKQFLNEINFPLISVYGGDDTLLCELAKTKKYIYGVAQDYYIKHPYMDISLTEYIQWKFSSILNFCKLRSNNYSDPQDYHKLIIRSHEWKK